MLSGGELNPTTKHREFSGVPGAIGITFGLPVLLFLIGLAANKNYSIQGTHIDFGVIKKQLPQSLEDIQALCFDKQCWLAYLGWFGGLAILNVILPGKEMKGIPLRENTVLNYNINGLNMMGLFVVILLGRLFQASNYYLKELQFIYDHQLQLTAVTIIFSFLLAVFVYVSSFLPLRKDNGAGNRQRILSVNGNTGNLFYDWFIGRELNPRIGPWDIKLFCELRPGLLLWMLINLSCVHNQYQEYGTVTDSLILVNVLQAIYVFDGVLNEEGVLSMMDITTDGFGFMLSFGDLAWLPWSYSLQARYLALPENRLILGKVNLALIVLINAIGYYIFHSSNKQKADFRLGKLNNLKNIETKTGSKLLCDGWWSLSQHMNYFGDWLIGWSWCLPTGFQTPLTYFYVVYFGVLLVHRQMRDDQKCREKYGDQWTEYTKRVPYKIVPFVY
ncbi:uncharacterized protein PRCAT00005906001 [Priceomyces carsonii]|uniref:uncharacterized protein n=1 Tax=Priceomyces carsonii TaxID=28549 RepID=UPI002ED951AE|nr:unnamed protein product [Priceomyces carsonii]